MLTRSLFSCSFEDVGHSEEARKDLSKYLIGDLKGGAKKVKAAAEKAASSAASSEGGMSPALMLAILVALLGVVFFVMQE